MKHAATPYKTDKSMSFYVLDENGNMVCNASTQTNAEFICRACNAHDELVEACQYFIFTHEHVNPNPNAWLDLWRAYQKAKAIITKIQDNQP